VITNKSRSLYGLQLLSVKKLYVLAKFAVMQYNLLIRFDFSELTFQISSTELTLHNRCYFATL